MLNIIRGDVKLLNSNGTPVDSTNPLPVGIITPAVLPVEGVIIDSDTTQANLTLAASYTTHTFDMTLSKILDIYLFADVSMQIKYIYSVDNFVTSDTVSGPILIPSQMPFKISVAVQPKYCRVSITAFGNSSVLRFQVVQRSVSIQTQVDQGISPFGADPWLVRGQPVDGGGFVNAPGVLTVGGISPNGATVWATRVTSTDPIVSELGMVTRPLVNGNVAAGSADVGFPVKVGGKAVDNITIPTAVGAAARVNVWEDLNGATMVRGGFRTSYVANYRLTGRPYALSNAFGAAGIKQYATIYHGAAAVKTVRVKQVTLYVKSNSAAAVYLFELRRLSATTAPATGNPAITPLAHNSNSAAAEVTCLALPTTAGSEAGANQGWGSQEIALGITAAGSVVNPPPAQTPINLYQDDGLTEIEPLLIRAGVAEGYAVIVDASAAATFTCTVVMVFTEE